MGVLKFRLPSNDPERRSAGFRKAYVAGLDRTPGRLGVDIRNGLMSCTRDNSESGRLFVPWPIAGYGTPVVGTATLSERTAPYVLSLELARGKLNDVRNQMADWTQMGLRTTPDLGDVLAAARRAFVRAAMYSDDPDICLEASQASLEASSKAGDLLTDSYMTQVLQNRLASTGKLTTHLGCVLSGDPAKTAGSSQWPSAMNAAQVSVSWRDLAPSEGKYRWDLIDAQLAWCRRHRLHVEVGPLIEFRNAALPDWIWLWDGDADAISGFATDLVRQAVARYRGKVPIWQVVHRPAGHEILGLSEEDQIRIAARAIQVARQADSSAQLCLGVDRPWAEWMSGSRFQLGPLHLCDYLIRSDVGISSVALEIAPGYSAPGSQMRDLFEFSRLLDLYALLNVPLHLLIVAPSADASDPAADPNIVVEPWQWSQPPNETLQADWAARWLALAVAKPFVRSVKWLQASDAVPHTYPHGGLYRGDSTPKPIFSRLQSLRKDWIA
jgi:hypothetical protein